MRIPQIFYGSEVLMTHTEGDEHGYIRKDFPGGWAGDKVSAKTGEGLTAGQAEMQEFFKTLLNWRKETPIMHTGRLTHFSPQNAVYVYFRHDDNQKVMVVLNKNNKEQQLDLERFAEIIGDSPGATDILTGTHYELGSTLSVPALTPLVLELE